MIGVDAFFNQFATIDVYRDGAFYNTYPVFGNGTFTVGFTFGSINNITKIVIRNINDASGIGFDNFSFDVDWVVKITNSRVNGYLNDTTQNGLLGANVTLLATALPSAFSGGSYLWGFTGPVSVVSATNAPSVTIRSTDLGAITANITYTKNGVPKPASIFINSILPTLTSFTAQQGSDFVTANGGCNSPDSFWWYRLGCIPPQNIGIQFTAAVQAPATFISDPAQSGIKYVQAVSAWRRWNAVGQRCITIRSSESNVESGWQRDSNDPYDPGGYPPMFFSQANNLSMPTIDYPKNNVTFIQPADFKDALYVDDQFWMYVFYFAGSASNPVIQRPIGRLRWNWGGLVVFDKVGASNVHNLRYTNAPPTSRTGEPTSSTVNMQGQLSLSDVPCPGGPNPLTNNKIDSSRIFVKYLYSDILHRSASDDPQGWDDWTRVLAQCTFDLNCIQTMRVNTALWIFWSSEGILKMSAQDPEMANPPGSPNFNPATYNPRFVFWCYQNFLGRAPDQPAYDNYINLLNSTNDYALIVYNFIYSPEYRNRPFV